MTTEQKTTSGERFSLVVTNLIKLGGLAVVFWELGTHGEEIRGSVLALAAFMLAGAQSIEALLRGVIGQGKQ